MLKSKAKRRGHRITVGEDKAYDCRDHVTALRRLNVTPHVAQNDALTKTGRRDVRFFDTGHFALETHCNEIAAAIRTFL